MSARRFATCHRCHSLMIDLEVDAIATRLDNDLGICGDGESIHPRSEPADVFRSDKDTVADAWNVEGIHWPVGTLKGFQV